MCTVYLIGGCEKTGRKFADRLREFGLEIVAHWSLVSGRKGAHRRQPTTPHNLALVICLTDSVSHPQFYAARNISAQGIPVVYADRTRWPIARERILKALGRA